MQELEAVQNADVTHKLSERSVVEIINKIVKKGLIDVIKSFLCWIITSSTRSGIREYLTWPELETEILSELDSHDGRVSFAELEVGDLR